MFARVIKNNHTFGHAYAYSSGLGSQIKYIDPFNALDSRDTCANMVYSNSYLRRKLGVPPLTPWPRPLPTDEERLLKFRIHPDGPYIHCVGATDS